MPSTKKKRHQTRALTTNCDIIVQKTLLSQRLQTYVQQEVVRRGENTQGLFREDVQEQEGGRLFLQSLILAALSGRNTKTVRLDLSSVHSKGQRWLVWRETPAETGKGQKMLCRKRHYIPI